MFYKQKEINRVRNKHFTEIDKQNKNDWFAEWKIKVLLTIAKCRQLVFLLLVSKLNPPISNTFT